MHRTHAPLAWALPNTTCPVCRAQRGRAGDVERDGYYLRLADPLTDAYPQGWLVVEYRSRREDRPAATGLTEHAAVCVLHALAAGARMPTPEELYADETRYHHSGRGA
jgi:hypothetical protein